METENKLKILFVEDVPSDKELAEMELRKEGFVFISEVVETKNDFIQALNVFQPDLIISDYSLPSFDGMQALKIAKEFYPTVPFILYTGSLNEETAVECIKDGAWDYIIKEHSARLPFAVKDAIEKKDKLKILKQIEEKYQSIFESTGTATLIVEEDTTITMTNNECISLTGYSSKELLGTKWTNYVAPESLEMMMKYNKIRLENPEKVPKKYEVSLLNKKGEVRNAILNIGFITETKQRIVSMLDITDRKKAEQELRKSKQDWEGIFNGLSHPTVILDAQHNVLEINDSLREKLGKNISEIKKFKCWNIFHEPSTNCTPNGCPFEQMVLTGTAKTTEMEMEAFGGFYLINCTPLFDDKGKLEKVIHIATDITERKKTERVLQEIISKNPMSIQIVDKNGYTLSVNSAHTQLFGVVPPPDFSIFNDSQLKKQGFKDLFERVKKGEIVHFPDSYYNVHDFNPALPDVPVWVRGVLFPLMDINGNPERFVLMQDDITERKKAEDELISSEAKYRNLIETMPEGFYRSTPEGYFVEVNPALVNMLGYDSKEELLKINIPKTLYFAKNERDNDVTHNVDFNPDTEVYRLRKKNGSEIWVEDNSRYIKDSSGNVLFHEGILRDVTESLRVHNEILEAKERAEEANKTKTNFLATMSHEIRTPLNGILGFSELLRSELTEPEHIKFTNVIERSGRRLLETLHLILTFAKLDAEKLDINYSNVNVEDVVDETIHTFEALAKTKYLYLKSVFNSKNITTRTDEKFLLQILNNLVNNAIKYTKSGGVTVELSKKDQKIIIKIIDTGIGIAKDKHDIIFEEFRQESEGFSRSFEGTGLGLSITKKFVELMKGKIYVESEQGKGSTFIVELPYETIPEPINIKLSNEEPVHESMKTITENEKKTSILIVEDDEENRYYIENILNDYKTDSAKDGPDALFRTKEKIYDIILMDINLGKGMDGIAAVKEIRKMDGYKNTPIVALTAYVMNGDKEEFLAAGCTHYLGKPFRRKQLVDIIGTIIKENHPVN